MFGRGFELFLKSIQTEQRVFQQDGGKVQVQTVAYDAPTSGCASTRLHLNDVDSA